eukprot:4558660-Amphidinium_carterae.1
MAVAVVAACRRSERYTPRSIPRRTPRARACALSKWIRLAKCSIVQLVLLNNGNIVPKIAELFNCSMGLGGLDHDPSTQDPPNPLNN